jgi:hypothetical protein
MRRTRIWQAQVRSDRGPFQWKAYSLEIDMLTMLPIYRRRIVVIWVTGRAEIYVE